jgi:crossover junction endodeoxyribonuclease RusA
MTARTLRLEVNGTPAPQGSKRHVGNGVMVESSKKVKPWRAAVHAALAAQTGGLVQFATGPLTVTVDFYLARPRTHYGTGQNADVLRDTAPARPTGYPDVDKLLRSTLDGLAEAGMFGNDSQVVSVHARKLYAGERPVGAVIAVTPC